MPREREVKVGMLVLSAVAVLAAGLLLLGTQEKLFVRKNLYFVRFADADGLAPGGVVELNGVNVGKVARVVLPREPGHDEIDVWIEIERQYAKRLRAPAAPAAPAVALPPAAAALPATRAEIKTQGLLGDKYVALTLGSWRYPEIPEHGEIAAARPFNFDALLASGGDVMGQVKEILRDLKGFTGNLNREDGGLVQRLVSDQEYGREVSGKLRSTLDNLAVVTGKVAHGQGTLGKLVADPSVYNGLSDVVAGVNQNKMLRWLIQNRQKAGAAAKSPARPPQSRQ